MKLFTALLLLLSLAFVGCQTAWPPDPALQILCRLDSTAIPPDQSSWVRLTDAKTGHSWKVFWFSGGPGSELPKGAVGYFDSQGILLGAKHVEHLNGLAGRASALRDNDSVILTTLEGKGTGVWDESIVVLTLYNGEWMETFRCVGDSFREPGFGEDANRAVTLRVEGKPQDGRCRLIREVVVSYYASYDALNAGKPSTVERSSQTYAFDPEKMRFVEAKKKDGSAGGSSG